MDIYCHKCGEPWDVFAVHELRLSTDGGTVEDIQAGKGCPVCKWGTDAPAKPPKRAEFASVLSDLLGDDIDGLAAELEDAEFLGLFDDEE